MGHSSVLGLALVREAVREVFLTSNIAVINYVPLVMQVISVWIFWLLTWLAQQGGRDWNFGSLCRHFLHPVGKALSVLTCTDDGKALTINTNSTPENKNAVPGISITSTGVSWEANVLLFPSQAIRHVHNHVTTLTAIMFLTSRLLPPPNIRNQYLEAAARPPRLRGAVLAASAWQVSVALRDTHLLAFLNIYIPSV